MEVTIDNLNDMCSLMCDNVVPQRERNTVYAFVRHCLIDPEFNAGGIPTKEKEYLKKLHWNENSEELHEFYDAMCTLAMLNSKQKRIDRMKEV